MTTAELEDEMINRLVPYYNRPFCANLYFRKYSDAQRSDVLAHYKGHREALNPNPPINYFNEKFYIYTTSNITYQIIMAYNHPRSFGCHADSIVESVQDLIEKIPGAISEYYNPRDYLPTC